MVNYLKIIAFELLDFIFIRCDIKHTIAAVFIIS